MLSYKIISKQLSSKQRTELKDDHLDPDDPMFKQKLFGKLLSRNKFTKGSPIRIVNTSKRGIITKIYTNFQDVTWEGSKPYFIEVCLKDGTQAICCPYDLTRKRA